MAGSPFLNVKEMGYHHSYGKKRFEPLTMADRFFFALVAGKLLAPAATMKSTASAFRTLDRRAADAGPIAKKNYCGAGGGNCHKCSSEGSRSTMHVEPNCQGNPWRFGKGTRKRRLSDCFC
jgi:hypothetical protein